MPAATIRSATSWAATAGVAITPIATPCSRTICSRSSKGRTSTPADDLAVAARVGVEQRDDAEAAAAEAGVVGQRVAEVADADDDDGPVLGHADLAGDLVAQVVDVVADAAGAVGAEVGEVLAQLGAVDAGRGGELLAGAGAWCRCRPAWSAPGGRRAAGRPWPRGCPGRSGSAKSVRSPFFSPAGGGPGLEGPGGGRRRPDHC